MDFQSIVVDPSKTDFTFLSALKSIAASALFATLFLLKSYLGPLVLGYVTGYSVYKYSEYEELIFVPGIEWLLSLVFSNVPPSLELWYTVIFSMGLDNFREDFLSVK